MIFKDKIKVQLQGIFIEKAYSQKIHQNGLNQVHSENQKCRKLKI